jgi:hypothetical protein
MALKFFPEKVFVQSVARMKRNKKSIGKTKLAYHSRQSEVTPKEWRGQHFFSMNGTKFERSMSDTYQTSKLFFLVKQANLKVILAMHHLLMSRIILKEFR